MSCKRIRPLLSAYLDGELDRESHTRVAAHLAGCQACARALRDFQALGQEIRALPDVPLLAGMELTFPTRRGQRALPAGGMYLLARGVSTLVLIVALVALAVGTSRVVQHMRGFGQPAEVVAAYPPDGATGVPLDTNLTLVFARPMDRASVEAAMSIAPAVQLAFAWQGQTLTVVPFADWQPATSYTLTVAATAREAEGETLAAPFVLRFTTAGAPPIPSPTASPAPSPTAASSATPTASPTLSPPPSPTGALHPIGRFGYLWRAQLNGPVGPLGYATSEEQELWSAVQPFERGLMIWLDQLYEDHVYVLAYSQDEQHGNWQSYVDTWREGDPESAGLTPPEGLLEPIRGIGRLWREELGGPEAVIGWALAPEQGYVGAVQPFEHGLMLWNPLNGTVYLLWDDAAWTAYPPSE